MRRAIVVGRSAAVMEEYAAACALCAFDEVLVVGEMGTHFPDRIDHWVSFHVELFDHWSARRAAAGFAPAGTFWGAIYNGRRLGASTTRCQPLEYVPCVGGSSGYMAVQVALGPRACSHVVLAGIPLEAAAAHHDSALPWREADKYWATWAEHMDELRGRVRSMSGRTRAALGEPTREWLSDQN